MRFYSMKSRNRRKHQRWLNAYCRRANKIIEQDSLWQGRFVVEQVMTCMEWFEDKSGGIMHCLLRFRDKKTGKTVEWYTNNLKVQGELLWHMNNFIVEDCKVWENEKPYEEWSDYRNVP